MTIQNEINEIRKHLDKILITQNEDFSDVFRYGLISKIQQVGGIYNPKIKDNNGDINLKKFFAFKFDPKCDVENQILSKMESIFNIINQYRHRELKNEWKNIEFNIFKLENLRDRDDFVDLYRGIVYFKRKQEENNGN